MTAPPPAASLFDTPVIVDQMPEAETLNAELKRLILERRSADSGIKLSNVGGWHSDTRMLSWGGEPALAVVKRVVAAADAYTIDIRAKGKARFRWVPEMWANVSQQGASNQFHTHPGAFWSAVYYVDDGYDGSDDDSLGGELVLLDPRMPMIRMAAPDLRFRRPGQQPEQQDKWLRPRSGMIVIFPSWLSHAGRPYNGTGLRISIAINLSAAPLPDAAPEDGEKGRENDQIGNA
jgi:uncharacterized protein (TIGR02466 family)